MITVYVDDFDLQATEKDSEKHWKDLERVIDFKDPPRFWSEKPTAHLGCQYRVTQKVTADGHKLTAHQAEMKSYLLDLVGKFEAKYKVRIKEQKTPYLDQSEIKKFLDGNSGDEGPKYGGEAASPLMAGLYAARSTRPDLNVSTLRSARRLTRWTVVDDAKLLRYLGYIKKTAGLGLESKLSTADLETAVLRIWPDADLAGDPAEDTHSSSGCWIELASADGSRTFPLHWSYSKQGFTAGHTQEAETAAAYDALRSDGLPLAALLEFLLDREILVEVLEDNSASIVAMQRGYSPKLRHHVRLHRSKRVHLGYLAEVFDEQNPQAHLVKASTKEQKGDILTKEMGGQRFEECKEMLGVIPIACGLPPRSGRLLLCIGGELKPVEHGLAELALINTEGSENLKPGVDAWVVDTGSGRHLISRKDLDKNAENNIKRVEEPLRLATANGVVDTNEIVKIFVRRLGLWVVAWVLEATPLVLSVDDLVDNHGFEFDWKKKAGQSRATLSSGGRKINLPIRLGVPCLPAR